MNIYKRLGRRLSIARKSSEEPKKNRFVLPKFSGTMITDGLSEDELLERAIEKLKNVNEFFPLMRMHHRGGHRVVVRGNIKWEGDGLIYRVVEPDLSPAASEVLSTLKSGVFINYKNTVKDLDKLAKKRNLSTEERLAVQYNIFKYLKGAGKIEPLLHDPNISFIDCYRQVKVKHSDPLFDWIKTDVVLNKPDLDLVYERMKNDRNTRVWFDKVFKIKKFSEPGMGVQELLKEGVFSIEVLAYLWLCVENGLSICVSGPSSSGITSVLQAIPSLVHPNKTVSTAEKDPEIRLNRNNWKPFVSENLFDSVRNAVNEKADYTLVNDVEGEEIYLLFQAMDSGYPIAFTIHSENLNSTIRELRSSVPSPLLESLDILVFTVLRRKGGKLIRRTAEINEILLFNRESDDVIMNTAFKWDPGSDDFIPIKSVLLDKLGVSEEELKKDLKRKMKLLRDAVKHGDIEKRLFR